MNRIRRDYRNFHLTLASGNDFYPFVRAARSQHDPTIYAIMQRVWGF